MKEVSIVDIANELGVSTATVSRALNNKEGVGDKTRKKVLDLAEKLNYKVNSNAKAMRKELNVLVIFPINDKYASFYTDLLWQGYQEEKGKIDDLKINFYDLYLSGNSFDEVDKQYLEKIRYLESENVEIDAAIVYLIGENKELTNYINRLYHSNIPIIALHKKKYDIKSNYLITDQARTIGELGAEISFKFNENQKKVLLIENQREKFFGEDETSLGYKNYLLKNHPDTRIYAFDQFDKDLDDKVNKIFTAKRIDSAFATTARSSVYLASKIKDFNLQDDIFFVCAGKNSESEKYLKEGICKCIIDNNPLEEGRQSVKVLKDILLKNNILSLRKYRTPLVKEVKSNLIFESNL